MPGEVVRESVDRVNLLGPDQLHSIEQLLEVAVIGERKGDVGAEDGPEMAVLGPTRDQGAAVAMQLPDDRLARRRREGELEL